MNPFLVELRHSSFRVAAPVILAVTAVFSLTVVFPSVASWANLLQAAITGAQLAGPLLAGFAAWEGLRPHRRHLAYAEETGARSSFHVRMYQFFACLTWAGISSFVVGLVLWIRAVSIGLSGHPTTPGLLLPLTAMLLAVTIGFVAAEIARRWVAVIVASGILVALLALDSAPYPLWVRALSPVHRLAILDNQQPNDLLLLGQIVVAVGASAALIGVTLVVKRARERPLVSALAALGFAASFLGGSVIYAQDGQNAVSQQADDLTWIDIENGDAGVNLQVLDLYAPVRDQLRSSWGRVADLTSGSDLSFGTLVQDPVADYANAPYPTFHRLDLNPLADDIAATSIEMAFNDVAACATQATTNDSAWEFQGNIIVRTWFQNADMFPSNVSLNDPRTLQALHSLNELSMSEAQQWVHEHSSNIRSCHWDPSDFPRL